MQRRIFLQVNPQQQAGKPQNNYTKANWNNLKDNAIKKRTVYYCVINVSVLSQNDT